MFFHVFQLFLVFLAGFPVLTDAGRDSRRAAGFLLPAGSLFLIQAFLCQISGGENETSGCFKFRVKDNLLWLLLFFRLIEKICNVHLARQLLLFRL